MRRGLKIIVTTEDAIKNRRDNEILISKLADKLMREKMKEDQIARRKEGGNP